MFKTSIYRESLLFNIQGKFAVQDFNIQGTFAVQNFNIPEKFSVQDFNMQVKFDVQDFLLQAILFSAFPFAGNYFQALHMQARFCVQAFHIKNECPW